MDSQLFSNFFAGLSALAAIISAICAFIAWYQSIGSKKAKAEAEERAPNRTEGIARADVRYLHPAYAGYPGAGS